MIRNKRKYITFFILTIFFMGFSVRSMASDITIRSLQTDDWRNFKQLRLAALQDSPISYGISFEDEACKTDEEWKMLCQKAQNGDGRWYVIAECDGELIGMLGAIELFGTYMRHQVELTQAYVDPRFRRLKMMERMFALLKEQLQEVDHLEQMIIWVTVQGNQVGRDTLEKFGFKLAGTLSKTIKFEEEYYDCCWLEARLRPLPSPLIESEAKTLIRPMNEHDIAKIVSRFSFPWSTPEKAKELWNRYYQEQQNGIRTVAVVEEDHEILGYGSLLRHPESPFFASKNIPEINAIWIDENHRGQGLGKALIQWIENLARQEGYDQIGIGVGLYGDYGPAQRLYFQLGYVPDGNGITYKGHPTTPGQTYPLDDDLILWLVKPL